MGRGHFSLKVLGAPPPSAPDGKQPALALLPGVIGAAVTQGIRIRRRDARCICSCPGLWGSLGVPEGPWRSLGKPGTFSDLQGVETTALLHICRSLTAFFIIIIIVVVVTDRQQAPPSFICFFSSTFTGRQEKSQTDAI